MVCIQARLLAKKLGPLADGFPRSLRTAVFTHRVPAELEADLMCAVIYPSKGQMEQNDVLRVISASHIRCELEWCQGQGVNILLFLNYHLELSKLLFAISSG